MESKAAAELLSLHHGNWGKKTKMYVGLQYCPPQSRQQSPETQGVCCPATVCRSGPGQLQPGCFQIQTLLWPQMRRPLVTSEQRPMMNFRKDQQIPWPATKCGNSTEARSEGDKEGKHHFKWWSSCFLPYRPGTALSCWVFTGMTEFMLSFPAGQHLSSHNSATILQTDLLPTGKYQSAISATTTFSPGQNLTAPRVTEKPPVVFP